MPPPTRLSSSPGSIALVGLRRASHMRQPAIGADQPVSVCSESMDAEIARRGPFQLEQRRRPRVRCDRITLLAPTRERPLRGERLRDFGQGCRARFGCVQAWRALDPGSSVQTAPASVRAAVRARASPSPQSDPRPGTVRTPQPVRQARARGERRSSPLRPEGRSTALACRHSNGPLMSADVLALFDLDHTLLTVDSDEAWVEFLIEEGLLDRASVRTGQPRNVDTLPRRRGDVGGVHLLLPVDAGRARAVDAGPSGTAGTWSARSDRRSRRRHARCWQGTAPTATC